MSSGSLLYREHAEKDSSVKKIPFAPFLNDVDSEGTAKNKSYCRLIIQQDILFTSRAEDRKGSKQAPNHFLKQKSS